MENTDIIGGVSPLKQRQKTRGGQYAGKATTTAKRRGGYAKSTGARGKGGRNVGGYNVRTRFTPRAAWVPPSDQSGPSIIPEKPYSYTPEGKLVVENPTKGTEYKQDADVVTTKMVGTDKDGNVVTPEGDACSDVYIKKHGTAKCEEYKEFRKKNPVDRSKRKKVQEKTTKDGQKWERTWTQEKGGEKVYTPWKKV